MTSKTDDKLNLYKQLKAEYATPKTPTLIETTPGQYLAAQGRGGPQSDDFQEKIGGLYGMAYTCKFNSKFAGQDYVVGKLEGIWHIADLDVSFEDAREADVNWTLLMRVPDFVKERDLVAARKQLREKGKEGDFDAVLLQKLHEGTCVQMLHVGPYEKERETIIQMRTFMEHEGLVSNGPHHEVYLSDPRRVPADRLRTILRMPVKQT